MKPIILQLNNYVKPVIKEESGKEWVTNGKNNYFYQYIIERYNGSPTNSAIINGFIELLYGKGLSIKNPLAYPQQLATLISVFPKKEVRKICSDFKLFGSASFQVIYAKGKNRKVTGVYHIPRECVAPEKMNEEGEVNGYWFCQDWSNTNKYKPEFYPKFGTSQKEIEFYVIEPYRAGKTYFADPDYIAALQYAQLEEEISNFSISHIQNGLSAGFVLNFNNGVPTEEKQQEVERDVIKTMTGSKNAARVFLSFNDNKETQTTIEAIPNNSSHEQWTFWTEEARRQIMVGHRVVSPMLFGIKDNTGLGNNADELKTAMELYYKTNVIPAQEYILDAFQEVAALNGITNEIVFTPLFEEQQNVSLKKDISDDFLNKVADELINMGEEEDNDFELIHEMQVETDPTLFEMKLAKTFSSFPNAKSQQDNSLFKVRYSYAPNSFSPKSREFCKKMITAGKVYRKEDIILAGDKVVNNGFGPAGAATYNIWLYKGGVNCKHFWQRKIYLRKNNKNISVNEARRIINELEPSERKKAKLEENDSRVAQPAQASNNFWKLN